MFVVSVFEKCDLPIKIFWASKKYTKVRLGLRRMNFRHVNNEKIIGVAET